jgi:hypothetical protein
VLFGQTYLSRPVKLVAVRIACLAGKAHTEPGHQFDGFGARPERIRATSDMLNVNVMQRYNPAQLVVFIVGHDGVLDGRIDQPVEELTVCTGDRPLVQAEIGGQDANSRRSVAVSRRSATATSSNPT